MKTHFELIPHTICRPNLGRGKKRKASENLYTKLPMGKVAARDPTQNDEPTGITTKGSDIPNQAQGLIEINMMMENMVGEKFSNMVEFRYAPSTLVRTVQESYAEHVGIPVSELVFNHHNRSMGSLGATISEDEIEDGEFITVKRLSNSILSNIKVETDTERKTPTEAVKIKSNADSKKAKAEEEFITITLVGQSEKVKLKAKLMVKPSTSMRKIMSIYAQKVGLLVSDLRFAFYTGFNCYEKTISDHNIADGDIIDVYESVTGC